MFKWLETEPAPAAVSVAAQDWPLLLQASTAIARLDERLVRAPAPVREGWVGRALIHEATASLRLEGLHATPQDLMLAGIDGLDRAGDQALGRAAGIHQMLLTLTRRNPANLFHPRRLMALARLRMRGAAANMDSRLPTWLVESMPNPERSMAAVEDALLPEIVSVWKTLPALAGSAAVIARWHNSGAADCIGGAAGRALSMAWACRAGLVSSYCLMPSIGFLRKAADYRPDLEGKWTGLFLRSCIDAVDWGSKLEGHLRAVHARLQEWAPQEGACRVKRVIYPAGFAGLLT